MGKLVLREKKTLWSAAAYSIPDFGGSGSQLFFKPDNTLSATDATNIDATYWLGPIETKGADRLIVQWAGVLGAQTGGLDAVTASPAHVYAVGLPYYDPNEAIFSQPPIVRATVTQALFEETAVGYSLQCFGFGVVGATGVAVLGGAGSAITSPVLYIPDSTDAATGDYTASWFEVSNRIAVQQSASGVYGIQPSISGVAAVWLALKVVPVFTDTGSVAGTLTSGKWLALLYDEMPETRQAAQSLLGRRDLKSNISAGS